MQAIVDEKYFKNTMILSPGLVGSVGDVLGSVRLKQSAPEMKLRYDQIFSGKNEPRSGSNVQDGYSYSYASGGGPARTLDSNWVNKKFKTNHGYIYQDMRAPDKTLTPVMGSTGRYDWYNRVANTYQAKITGDLFLPLPGGYKPSGVPRGGQVPRVIAIDEPVAPPLTNEKWDKTKQVTEQTMMSVVVCTDNQGKQTYKVVPGKMSGSAKVPPTAAATQPTAATAPKPANQTSTTAEPDWSNIKWGW
jgi:hypothetical protein